jgi:hypothetical protein
MIGLPAYSPVEVAKKWFWKSFANDSRSEEEERVLQLQ